MESKAASTGQSTSLLNKWKRLWSYIPAGPVKDRIRVEIHNRKAGGSARYAIRNGIYQTCIDGVKLRTHEHSFGLADAQREYQVRHLLQPGEVVLDAGAHVGHLTLFYALKVGPSGRVIALEPDDANRSSLLNNLSLNGDPSQVQVLNSALWDQVGQVEFYSQGTVGSSIFWAPEGSQKGTKATTTIDTLVQELGLLRLDFIKMDIEGAEVRALNGAVQTLRELAPDVAIASYHMVDGNPTYPSVEEVLRSNGYSAETVFIGNECITYGTPPRSSRAGEPVDQ